MHQCGIGYVIIHPPPHRHVDSEARALRGQIKRAEKLATHFIEFLRQYVNTGSTDKSDLEGGESWRMHCGNKSYTNASSLTAGES